MAITDRRIKKLEEKTGKDKPDMLVGFLTPGDMVEFKNGHEKMTLAEWEVSEEAPLMVLFDVLPLASQETLHG